MAALQNCRKENIKVSSLSFQCTASNTKIVPADMIKFLVAKKKQLDDENLLKGDKDTVIEIDSTNYVLTITSKTAEVVT